MKFTQVLLCCAVSLAISFGAPLQAGTVYVTADNGSTNLFGTLDVATGQFTEIATTDPLFFALTTGAGGTIYGADVNSGHLFTVTPSGQTTQFGSVTAPDTFFGLAFSQATGNFFADNLNPNSVTLHTITGDGNGSSFLAQLAGPNEGFFPTGNLTFGPGGKLYFDFSSDLNNGGANSTLYTVNTSTGALTPVGTGLGTDILALFSDGTTLYGVDSITTSNIGIFAINTTTGVATQLSTVTGLPGSGDFFVDTAAASVPDSGSTLKLLCFAGGALLGVSRLQRRIV